MSDWYWVGLAYGIVAVTLTTYTLLLRRRTARVRRILESR